MRNSNRKFYFNSTAMWYGIYIAVFNAPLDTLQIISGTILQVR